MRGRPRASSLQPVALADRLSRSMMVMAAALTFVLAIVILADTISREFSRHPLGGERAAAGRQGRVGLDKLLVGGPKGSFVG